MKETKEYYVPEGLTLKVKPGDIVEQGQALSDGVANPYEVVKLKGIGEGRKYYADTLFNAFKDSGMRGNRRNFELVAKSAIDHVKINDDVGVSNYLPGEIVSYQALEKNYIPRVGYKIVTPALALNKYLEQPVLHYTIGTKVTSSVVRALKDARVQNVAVHDTPPAFEPEMVKLLDVPEHTDDWMHQLYSTYLEKRFVNLVNKGSKSSIKGPSPIAGLAYGVGFASPVKKAEEEYTNGVFPLPDEHDVLFKLWLKANVRGEEFAVPLEENRTKLVVYNVASQPATFENLSLALGVTNVIPVDEQISVIVLPVSSLVLLDYFKTTNFAIELGYVFSGGAQKAKANPEFSGKMLKLQQVVFNF